MRSWIKILSLHHQQSNPINQSTNNYPPLQRHCLALDLRPDPVGIAAYEAHHRAVWPEVLVSLQAAGITCLEIYRIENRLCMLLETDDAR